MLIFCILIFSRFGDEHSIVNKINNRKERSINQAIAIRNCQFQTADQQGGCGLWIFPYLFSCNYKTSSCGSKMSETEELFTTRMRKATRKIHSVSDALVNAKFAISLREETVWGGGLFVFYHIFAYLEDAKDRLNMPDFNSLFVHRTLHRKKAFEDDLQHYLGDNWQCTPKSQALENYLEHLQGLEKENPTMLMAYVYHLYLGLLSGGQILAKKRKMFGNGAPTKDTYQDKLTDFSEVDIPQLKNDFRKAMNTIAEKQTEEWRQAFIEESSQVFLMNNLIVDSVGGQYQVLKSMLLKASAVAVLIAAVIMAWKHK